VRCQLVTVDTVDTVDTPQVLCRSGAFSLQTPDCVGRGPERKHVASLSLANRIQNRDESRQRHCHRQPRAAAKANNANAFLRPPLGGETSDWRVGDWREKARPQRPRSLLLTRPPPRLSRPSGPHRVHFLPRFLSASPVPKLRATRPCGAQPRTSAKAGRVHKKEGQVLTLSLQSSCTPSFLCRGRRGSQRVPGHGEAPAESRRRRRRRLALALAVPSSFGSPSPYHFGATVKMPPRLSVCRATPCAVPGWQRKRKNASGSLRGLI